MVTSGATLFGRAYWSTERLWDLVAGLPVQEVVIRAIPEFEQDCWFGGRPATCRAVAEHARRILGADLSYPVILSSDGQLMDRGHRLAKAWLEGFEHVRGPRHRPALIPASGVVAEVPGPGQLNNLPPKPVVRHGFREQVRSGS